MNLSGIRDVNELKRLLAAGQISQDDLNNAQLSGSFGPADQPQMPQQMPQQNAPMNALQDMVNPDPQLGPPANLNGLPARFASGIALAKFVNGDNVDDGGAQSRQPQTPQQQPPDGSNYVRNEQTGHITYLTPQGLSDSPSMGAVIQHSPVGAPSGGSAYTGTTQMMPQKVDPNAPAVTRVLGSGNGTTVDLGAAQQGETSRPALASGRNPIDIPGAGRGYYGTDGNAYVPNGDGSWTKVVLGYDMQGSMALNKANLEREKTQSDIAATNEHIRASQVQNPDMGSMSIGSGLSGDSLLQSLDPGTAGLVKAYAEGRLAFPGGAAMRSPRMMQLLSLVSAYDPSFDAKDFNTRNKAQIAFTSGRQADAVRAADQAITHAAALSDDIGSLNNFNGLATPLNYIKNPLESAFGDPTQGRFKQNALALSSELRKVFAGGGGGGLSELQSWESGLPLNASQEQQRQYLAKGMDLLQGAIGALNDQYQRASGPRADIKNLFSPTARAALQKLQLGDAQPTALQQAPQAQANSNIPPQAVAFLRNNPASRYDFDRKYGQGASAQVLGQ